MPTNTFFSCLLRARPLAALLLLAGGAGPARAQAPAWQSALVVGGSSASVLVKATATSAGGDLYVAGSFSSFVTIGSTQLQSLGGTDGFVAKWSAVTESFVWAQRLGGSDMDQVTALAVSGNRVYLAGTFFSPTAGFGALNIANAGGFNTVGTDGFVARLTDAGPSASFDWAQPLGGTASDAATALAATGGSVYVGGHFASPTATFGSLTLTNSTTAPVAPDGFVAKLTDAATSASVSWVQPITGPAAQYVNALAVNGAAVYATGHFSGVSASFGPTTVANAGGTADAYVAKLADAGATAAWQWVLPAGGTGHDVGSVLAVRGTQVYVAGSFSSPTLPLGSLSIANAGPTGTADAFVAAVADAGSTATWRWAQPAGGTADDQATALVPVGVSGLYLAGTFGSGAVALGGAPVAGTSGCALLASLTDAGTTATANWTQRGGPTAATPDAACLAMAGGRLYMAGSFQTTATFGTSTLTNSLASAANFLASLTDAAFTPTAATPTLAGAAFTLAPNPARAATSVQLPAVPGAPTANLTLTDALGRVVHTETLPLPATGLRHPLALAGLAPGIYAVRVRAGTATATQRLVVE